MNLFDGLQRQAFSIVTNTMGYDAIWTPSDESPQQTARVLFKENSVKGRYDVNYPKNEMDHRDYDPEVIRIEYHLGSFTGLKEAVDQKQDEKITINSVDYYASKVVGSVDGKNFIVDLLPL